MLAKPKRRLRTDRGGSPKPPPRRSPRHPPRRSSAASQTASRRQRSRQPDGSRLGAPPGDFFGVRKGGSRLGEQPSIVDFACLAPLRAPALALLALFGPLFRASEKFRQLRPPRVAVTPPFGGLRLQRGRHFPWCRRGGDAAARAAAVHGPHCRHADGPRHADRRPGMPDWGTSTFARICSAMLEAEALADPGSARAASRWGAPAALLRGAGGDPETTPLSRSVFWDRWRADHGRGSPSRLCYAPLPAGALCALVLSSRASPADEGAGEPSLRGAAALGGGVAASAVPRKGRSGEAHRRRQR